MCISNWGNHPSYWVCQVWRAWLTRKDLLSRGGGAVPGKVVIWGSALYYYVGFPCPLCRSRCWTGSRVGHQCLPPPVPVLRLRCICIHTELAGWSWLVNLNIVTDRGGWGLFFGGTSMSLKQAFWYIKFFKAKQVQLLINFVGFLTLQNCLFVSVSPSTLLLEERRTGRPGVKTFVILCHSVYFLPAEYSFPS